MLYAIYEEFKKVNPHHAKVMMDFVPLDDKAHIPVQAADVAAWVTFRYAEDWAVNPTTDNLKRLRSSMYKIIFWNESQSEHSGRHNVKQGDPARTAYVILDGV